MERARLHEDQILGFWSVASVRRKLAASYLSELAQGFDLMMCMRIRTAPHKLAEKLPDIALLVGQNGSGEWEQVYLSPQAARALLETLCKHLVLPNRWYFVGIGKENTPDEQAA